MSDQNRWERIERRTIMDTRFMRVYEDTLKLPDGKIVDDYSIVNLPDGVLVVASDEEGRLILFREYKYAVNETVLTFPAGGLDGDESPNEAALRELLEEAGYESDEVEHLAALSIYPSKIEHKTHIVRVKNAKKVTKVIHEDTETIGDIELISPEEIPRLMKAKQFSTMYMLSGLALAFPEYLKD